MNDPLVVVLSEWLAEQQAPVVIMVVDVDRRPFPVSLSFCEVLALFVVVICSHL